MDELKSFDLEKINVLISYNALDAYKVGVTFDQLKDLETEQIKDIILIMYDPKNKLCTTDELKKLLIDKIKDLTHHTSEEYGSDSFDLQDINSLKPSEVIIDYEVDLTGQQVVYAY